MEIQLHLLLAFQLLKLLMAKLLKNITINNKFASTKCSEKKSFLKYLIFKFFVRNFLKKLQPDKRQKAMLFSVLLQKFRLNKIL